MIGLLASLSLFSSLLPHPGGQVLTERQRSGGWTLEVRRDSFSGAVSCRIAGPDAQAAHGVATFRFHQWVDTFHAQFKLDDGKVISAQAVGPEAAEHGARLWTDNISNPSDGRVAIPLDQLVSARAVTIRPNPHSRPRTFRLEGLHSLSDAAKSKGCDA